MRSSIQKFLIVLFCLCSILFGSEPARIWLDVPFVKQERNGCGAASIAMIMQYWRRQQGRPTGQGSDAEQIQRELYTKAVHGIYASSLERYLQQHGFQIFAFRGEWNDLEQHLEKGRPLIAALKPDSRDAALHYVVVVGVDREQSLVLVNDPAERKLLQREQSHFEREWKGAGNWTLLALPREDTSSAR
jgi:ABC-type bacteriocin/lantibiotic exporter with double-glycine peptidase domain